MAQFSMGVRVVKRSEGRSILAAAAYRSGEKIHEERQGIDHDFRHKHGEVGYAELMFPADAPAWVQGISREQFWNAVDAGEKRKDAQTARDLRIMLPREVPPSERVALVREFVQRCFLSKGMCSDVCFHNRLASDGLEQPHVHILLTMRPLTSEGFAKKSRHDWVADPSGRTHANGRPVMIESNADSWNSATYYESCREAWEVMANEALARAGSEARIDRRSLLDRGLSRLPEPALRLAFHLKDLYGVMRGRFGQFQVARHYREVEQRANAAIRNPQPAPAAPGQQARTAERFFGWIERQVGRLAPDSRERAQAIRLDAEIER